MLNDKKYKIFSERPYQVSKNQILTNGFRASPSSQRKIIKAIGDSLENQVDSLFNGSEIGSAAYVKNSNNRFIKTGNIQNQLLIDVSSVEYCKITNNHILQGNEILIAEDGGGEGLGECCLYIKDSNYNDYICNGILALKIKDATKRNYIFGFLKSKYFKEYIDNNTPMASTLRHSNGVAKNFIIPVFNKDNTSHQLLSLMIENLIDKESQIRTKNDFIDQTISEELNLLNLAKIEASKSLFIKNDFRFAGGLYNEEFLKVYQGIQNYKHGFFSLLNKYNSKRGQNLQISNIGSSHYSSIEKPNFYRLVTTMELSDQRTIHSYRFLGNKNKLSTVQTGSIMLSADGTVGKSIYVGTEHFISNIHQWILTPKYKQLPEKAIFGSLFLQWLRNNNYYEYIKDKANGGAIKEPHLQKFLNIPKFPKEKQIEISKQYYNEVENFSNNITNYLLNESKKNSQLGIWQLNMECFQLKSKINKLVEKIIFNKRIHIPFYLC